MSISNGKKEALKQILMNYANNSNATSYGAITAITSILDCDGEKTLRDEFAMAAMQSILANNKTIDRNLLGESAYFYADGMMAYRK